MSLLLSQALCAVLSLLAGSIPFSLIVARIGGGVDLRKVGSGNVGATNVARSVGAKWGILALILDAAKGALPVWLLPMLFRIPTESLINTSVLCGTAAILGHMFSPFLNFKGGKGVATALGVVMVLSPAAMGIAFLTFAITFAATRIVSISSMLASVAYAIAVCVNNGSALWSEDKIGLGIFAIAIPALIILRHWPNIVRLAKGEEKQLSLRRTQPASESSSPENG
jgi:glycerol-3-phosphate acyltransferase PlsY